VLVDAKLVQTTSVQTVPSQTVPLQTSPIQLMPIQLMPIQFMFVQDAGTRFEVGERCFGAEMEAPAETKTILLVEDEAFVRKVTCEVLRSAGYRVLTARNAAEAISVYDGRRGEVELLLADVVLPGETGRALAGRLRQENPELKILLVTGYGEQMSLPEKRNGLKREAKREECLAKPFSSEVLLRRVRQLLDRVEPVAVEGVV